MSYDKGKFDSARDEVLFYVAFDSMWNDDHMGESDSPTGYFGKLDLNLDDATAIVMQFAGMDEPPAPAELVGFWLISEASSGFVSVSDMTDKRSMDDAYDELSKAYDDYRMCQQCALCGELLDEWGQGEDLAYCVGTDTKHVVMERVV